MLHDSCVMRQSLKTLRIKFRNVVPQFVEDMLKKHQLEAWNKEI
jgi:hypothetical protein